MPVTEQQLSTLSPEDASAVLQYQVRFGDAVAQQLYESIVSGPALPPMDDLVPPPPQGLPPTRRQAPTESEISRAFAGAADQGMREEASEIIEAPRTVRGERVGEYPVLPGSERVQPGELETATPWEAVRLSFFPQPLVTPEGAEAAKKRKAEKRKTAADVEAQLRKEASQATDSVYQPGQNRKALENQQYQRQVKSHLDEARGRLRRNARNFYYDTEGNEAAPQGSARRAEQEAEIQGIADELYLEYRSDVFGDLEPVLDEVLPERTRSQRVLRWAQGLLSEETAEGIPYETPLAAGMRDIGMLIRPLTKPFIDAISYEVDEEGNPLDESDFIYQMYQAQEEALQKIEAGEGSLADYASAATGFLPTAMLSRRTLGERGEVSTGNYIRDIAISGAKGRFLGDDYSELSATKRTYEALGLDWMPWALGLGTEIALPVTPAPGVKPVAKAGLRGGSRGADMVAETADLVDAFGTVAKGARTVSKAAEAAADPIGKARARLIHQDAKAVLDGLSPSEKAAQALEDSTTLSQSARALGEAAADAVIGDKTLKPARTIQAAKTTGKKADEAARAAEEASNIIETVKAVANRIAKAVDEGSSEGTKGIVKFMEKQAPDDLIDEQGLQILKHIDAAWTAGYRGKELQRVVLTEMATPLFKERLANVIPNDWIRPGDTLYTLVSRKAYQELSSKVKSISEPLLLRKNTTADGTFLVNAGKVADMIVKNMGAKKIAQTERLTRVVGALRRGDVIANEDYAAIVPIVMDEIWKTATDASVTLQRTGAAWERSSEVLGRRTSLFRNTSEMWRSVQTFFRDGVPEVVTPKANPANIKVATWLDETQQALVDLPSRTMKKLADYAEKYGVDGFDKFLEDITTKTMLEFDEGATAAQKASIKSSSDVSDLETITMLFFWRDRWNIAFGTNVFRKELVKAGITKVTTENVQRAIALARKESGSGLVGGGLRKGLGRGTGEDHPAAAILTWAMDQGRKATIAAKEAELASMYPEMFFGFGKRAMDHSQFADALTAAGAPAKLATIVSKHASTLAPSIRKEVFEQVLLDMWQKGSIDVMEANQRLAAAIGSPDRITKLLMDIDETKKAIIKYVVEDKGIDPNSPGFDQAVQQLTDDISVKIFEMMTEMNTDKIAGQLGVLGVGLSSEVGAKWAYFPTVMTTPLKRALLVDPETAALAGKLWEDSASGKLQSSLEALKRADMELGDWYINMFVSAMNTIKRTTISGFLGGFPLPNSRFIGLNVTSAPFIAAITSPGYVWAAVKAIPDGALGRLAKVARDANVPGSQKASSFLRQKMMAQPDDVVFTTRFGRQYTKREFDKLVDEKNVRFSQVTFEFHDTIIDEMMRSARIAADGSPVGSAQSVARWMDPRKKNLWNRWTEESDMAFREAVFREALIRGENADVAADLARNALLDYGAINPKVRKSLSMFTLFYAFPIKNTQEVAKAFLRDPGAVRNLRRIMLITQQQHREMGTWAYEDDWHRNRLWVRYGEEFDGISSRLYGPSVPAITGFETLMNSFAILTLNDRAWGNLGDYAIDSFLQNPALATLRDWYKTEKRREGPSHMYDPQSVVFLQSVGLWGAAQEFFGIETVPADKMRAGEPEFTEDGKSVQYRFKDKKSLMKWNLFKALGIVTSVDRNIRDYTAELGRMGVIGEDAELKRHSDGKWYWHAAALETPMKVSDEIDMKLRQRRQILEELRALLQ